MTCLPCFSYALLNWRKQRDKIRWRFHWSEQYSIIHRQSSPRLISDYIICRLHYDNHTYNLTLTVFLRICVLTSNENIWSRRFSIVFQLSSNVGAVWRGGVWKSQFISPGNNNNYVKISNIHYNQIPSLMILNTFWACTNKIPWSVYSIITS